MNNSYFEKIDVKKHKFFTSLKSRYFVMGDFIDMNVRVF